MRRNRKAAWSRRLVAEQQRARKRDREKPGARINPKRSDTTAQRIDGGHHADDDDGGCQQATQTPNRL